jgi:iron complex outermembrane receptor protein
MGGSLTDQLNGRISILSQTRDDWIDNTFSGKEDAMGGYDETAIRAQLGYEGDDFSALLSLRTRELEGTASMFRANILSAGSNHLNDDFKRNAVSYDADGDNPQSYENTGASLTMEWQLDGMTLTSITGIETADGRSKGDIDGGTPSGPGVIPFTAVTEDRLNDLRQFTQELRLASDTDSDTQWQLGLFTYDASFDVTSDDGFFGASTVSHDNNAWAVFAQADHQVNEQLTVSGGIRYTYDEKSLFVGEQNVNGFALVIGAAQIQNYPDIHVDDGQVSWDLQANYKVSDNTSVYSRLSSGFRAQTIQGRDVAFEGAPSVAAPETINSAEVGIKTDLLNDKLRLNAALYYYEIDDMQFSAIGGDGNNTRLVNADKGIGQGYEIDLEWMASDNLMFTAGYSFNDTKSAINS